MANYIVFLVFTKTEVVPEVPQALKVNADVSFKPEEYMVVFRGFETRAQRRD